MTEKQNYLMLLRGEQPGWIPHYPQYANYKTPFVKPLTVKRVSPSFLSQHILEPGPTKDIWGNTYLPDAMSGNSKTPDPNNNILKDIRQWRDVVKAPDLSQIDWETMAKKDFEAAEVDREDTAISFGLFMGYFQLLAAFMGFEGALCAMYEEPDEVKALLEYLCEFYVGLAEKCIDYYKPDIFSIGDDNATLINPFFSLNMYRDLFKPFVMKQVKTGHDRGLPVEMHCCGRCEDFIEDWMDYGVVSWNPGQTSNDLLAIKKKYGKRFVINGGWDQQLRLLREDATEDMIKEAVYTAIKTYAPGGAYAFCGVFLGPVDDEMTHRKNRWIAEAVDTFGRSFYS